MNQNRIYLSKIMSGILVLMLFSFTSEAFAADCLVIRKNIQQQTDLLKRRELIEQSLVNCPNDSVINFKYAYSLERFRKYKKALKHYQVATKLDPKYAKAYFGMGDMYLQTGKPHQSVAAYKKGLSLDPSNKRAARSMQAALAKSKATPKVNPTTTNIPPKILHPKPATTAVLVSTAMMPYSPGAKTIFQTPQNQVPIVAAPLGKELIQSFTFSKAGHSDATGTLDDHLMGSN